MAKRTRKPKQVDDGWGKFKNGPGFVDPSLNQHIKNGLDRFKVSQDAGEQVVKELAELAKDGVQFGVK